ncbi:MAG: SusC/RagA family TonB-linked outer membrane protein [Muribaculaceae bacterium]|nr:SusC/RagA family TonB-linked outer membrane protein [Muribaculaceae bacterium]
MKKLLLMLWAVCMLSLTAVAQNQVVSGTVLSANDGEPLIGATVMTPDAKVGTTTDIDGNFSISVPETVKKLRFSYVGTTPVEANISSNMIVKLQESSTLNEVVVTGYGTVSKQAFTGASSSVSGASIEKKSDVNLVKGLEGNVTGFQYNNSTSSPGTWGSVYIRGLGSLSSTATPLYVIDGVPVSSTADGISSDNNNFFDPMAAYNPADIESVTVLKDAAATAIYGSRAANGVIVITTKKGASSKFQLNIDVKQGFSGVQHNNMKYANAKQTMDLFARGYAARTGYSYDDCYEIMQGQYPDWDGSYSTNWMDLITRKGYFQEYNVSFSGTADKTNYYVSLGMVDADGIVIGSNNKRYSGRVNLDTSWKFFTAGLNAGYSYTENNNFSQATTGSMASPIVAAQSSMTPMDRAYNADGSYANVLNYNPLALQDPKLGDLSETINQTFTANPWLQVNLPFGFYVKTNFGVNIIDQTSYEYWSAMYNPQGMDYNGLGQKYISRASTLTWTNTIGWNKTFNDIHNFNVLLGQEMQRYEYHYDYYSRTDFPFAADGFRNMAGTGSDNGSEYGQEQSRLASYFIDARYALMDRYFFSASYRRDGSSVFGANHRWGNFWSVGAKWRLTAEDFLQDQLWLSNADLRVSYGTVGNQALPSLYASRGIYEAGYSYAQTPGIRPAQLANDELTWETSRKFDVGFDFGIFNRANLTFDFYNEDTADALYKVPLSYTTGLESVYRNVGKIRNTGVEIGLNGTVFTNDKVSVNAFANMTWNKNKILKLANGTVVSTFQILEEGYSYRQFKMPEYAGVDRETGRALYYLNPTGDELTDDYYSAAKRYVGSADPKVFGAFGVSAKGWGFDLSVQFNYRAGNKVFNYSAPFNGWGMSLFTPLETVWANSWTPENPDALYPQYIYGDPYNDVTSNYSTRFLMDGSYVRLSNISLGYTLPSDLTKKALMSKVRFYINLDNIATWTKKSFIGYNPDTYANGIISWQYPAAFSFTGGVQVQF